MKFLKSSPGETPIQVAGSFTCARRVAFRAWTDPDAFVQWFGLSADGQHGKAKLDPRPGGAWQFDYLTADKSESFFRGEYFEVEADSLLAFSWQHVVVSPNGERTESPVSLVRVSFSESNGQTHISLRHEALQTEGVIAGVGYGWSNTFGSLTTYLDQITQQTC